MFDLQTLLAGGFRWLHLVAAAATIGGTIFARFALVPALDESSPDERQRLHEAIRSRWSKVVMAAILFLLVSGFYNFFGVIKGEGVHGPYHMLFGIKFLLAMVIFFLASALSGRSALAQKLRANARFWLTVNLALALILVAISGAMRTLHGGKPAATAEPVAMVESR